jgi:head-tail adaptor
MSVLQPMLNRRLVLEGRERVPDGLGGYSETWLALGVHWADVTPRRGRAAEQDTLPSAATPVDIVMRAMAPGRPGRPRPDQRFREGLRVYRIEAVTEADPGARFLVCHAVEEEVSP